GDWKGSGRSIASFDLHAALGACAEHLERFGGHRAAAGLSIRPDRVEAFAAAFAAQADSLLSDDDLTPPLVVDAVVPGRACRLEPNTWNGTTAPQLVVRRIFESSDGYRELRAQLAAEWRAGPEQWSDTSRAVFEELGLDGTSWRSLLESETFRALLEPEPAS